MSDNHGLRWLARAVLHWAELGPGKHEERLQRIQDIGELFVDAGIMGNHLTQFSELYHIRHAVEIHLSPAHWQAIEANIRRMGRVAGGWRERYRVVVDEDAAAADFEDVQMEASELARYLGDFAEKLEPSTPEPEPKASPNDPRDRYIYTQRQKGKSLKAIQEVVNKRRTWEPLDSVQGISKAAKAYADRHGLARARRSTIQRKKS